MKPRVIILSAFLSPRRSGAEACVEEVAKRLAGKFAITIVTARLDRSVPRSSSLVSDAYQTIQSDRSARTNNGQRNPVHVVRVGTGHSFDKWLFPFLAPFACRGIACSAPTGSPVIVHAILETFAGLALYFCKWLVPGAARILTLQTTNRSFLKGPIVRSPHRVTAISAALQAIAAGLGRTDVEIIPNGIDVRAIADACHKKVKVLGRILFVGRLEPMKGVDTLLDAFSRIAHEFPQASLRVVGDGSMRSFLVARSSLLVQTGRAAFMGFVPAPKVYEEFAAAEIFCGLSRSEALGNVFLEAQAAGCAVIATRVGGIPEIVEDGKTGLLVPPDDVPAAHNALRKLLRDAPLRRELSERGKSHAESFDWDVIARRYGAVYDRLHEATAGGSEP